MLVAIKMYLFRESTSVLQSTLSILLVNVYAGDHKSHTHIDCHVDFHVKDLLIFMLILMAKVLSMVTSIAMFMFISMALLMLILIRSKWLRLGQNNGHVNALHKLNGWANSCLLFWC